MDQMFYQWLNSCSALSAFCPQITHFVSLTLSPPSLSQLRFNSEKTLVDSAHIAKLLTGHTFCRQGTMHTCYQRLLVKPPQRNQCFPRPQIRRRSVKTSSGFIRLPANTSVLFSTSHIVCLVITV